MEQQTRYGRRIIISRGGVDTEFEAHLGPFTQTELGHPPTDAGAAGIALRVTHLFGIQGQPVLGGVTSDDPEYRHRGLKNDDGHILGAGLALADPGDPSRMVIGEDEEIGDTIAVTVEITDPAGQVLGRATLGGKAS